METAEHVHPTVNSQFKYVGTFVTNSGNFCRVVVIVHLLIMMRLMGKVFLKYTRCPILQNLFKSQIPFFSLFACLNYEEQMSLLCDFFSYHCSTAHNANIPADYHYLSVCAMKNLEAKGKLNLLYELAKGFGTMSQGMY